MRCWRGDGDEVVGLDIGREIALCWHEWQYGLCQISLLDRAVSGCTGSVEGVYEGSKDTYKASQG